MLDDYNTVQFQEQSQNRAFSKKRNNLNELIMLINIPTMVEERSMVQISFMTQDQTSRQAQSGIRAKIYS